MGGGGVQDTVAAAAASSDSWAPLLYGSALGAVHTYAPWMEDSAGSFFTLKRGGDVPNDAFTLGNLAHDFTRCSFDNVMFCGREGGENGTRMRRNIVVCGILSIVGWAVFAWFVSTLPFVGSGLGTFVFASMLALVPITALQLAYGMAYTCFPMLPTCLVQVRPCIHTHTHIHAYTDTYTHDVLHTQKHIHKHTHPRIHIHIHTRCITHTKTHTQTYNTHTNRTSSTRSRPSCP